ncbi:pyrazinamidase/nicotinamidase [Fomitopsis serialis]|uniref:pyrazinamidase/nicotinamidase n=1 Tax=Fomitopsis serialis TaxID=139415 RepID=UPI0020073DC5|nr:pyrazinamidase/nicotinamidase [Neoantrodia serialis]KAH9927215.1 pyrazinamidase/nicotinamidase [Neoantrodia serialis]
MSATAFRPALLIVDVQEDFCPRNGALAVPDGRAVVPDHHPPNHVSFASNHGPDAEPYTSVTTITNPANARETYETQLWPDHCVAGTPGNALVRELAADRLDRVVLKGTDPRVEMYSAFRSPLRDPPLASAVSELADLLRGHEVTEVFVTGLAGDYCVFHSAMDCAEEGWKTYVVEEATRSVGGQEGWEKAAAQLKEKGVGIVRADGEEVGRVRELSGNA